MKNSPYVGWFRHAPPSKRTGCCSSGGSGSNGNQFVHKVDPEFHAKLDRWHQQLVILLGDLSIDNSSGKTTGKIRPCLAEIINGRLLGGGKSRSKVTATYSSKMLPDPRASSAAATLLSRFSSWLHFPLLLYDDEDVTECYNDYKRAHRNGLKLLEEDRDESTESDDAEEDEHDDDESSVSSAPSTDVDDKRDFSGTSDPPRGDGTCFSGVNVSVSEIAESYYAHQLIDERRSATRTRASDGGDADRQEGGEFASFSNGHHLDYVITQMDIARMARNASRHLDVDSILTLPTVTYRKPMKRTQSSHQTHQLVCRSVEDSENVSSTREDGWSFVMVSGIKSTMPSPATRSTPLRLPQNQVQQHEEHEDVCVICLEAFLDGDRLRVLPCDHSFHVGCIDRWLSGSHSHNECFTAGCPTCKKRPAQLMTAIPTPEDRNQHQRTDDFEPDDFDMDGSVPSWAFAKLGSAMAMSSGDVAQYY